MQNCKSPFFTGDLQTIPSVFMAVFCKLSELSFLIQLTRVSFILTYYIIVVVVVVVVAIIIIIVLLRGIRSSDPGVFF